VSWYERNKKAKLEYSRQHYLENKERILPTKKLYRDRIKIEVFSTYCPGEIKCACCQIKYLPFLTIDHINRDGADHRKQQGNGFGGYKFYLWLKRNDYPTGFRVLCFNCQKDSFYNEGVCRCGQ